MYVCMYIYVCMYFIYIIIYNVIMYVHTCICMYVCIYFVILRITYNSFYTNDISIIIKIILYKR